jgi:hypothetical protein
MKLPQNIPSYISPPPPQNTPGIPQIPRMLPSYAILELLHESWHEVLRKPERLDRNPDGCHSLRLLPRGRELRGSQWVPDVGRC